jgi:hypothetical protein
MGTPNPRELEDMRPLAGPSPKIAAVEVLSRIRATIAGRRVSGVGIVAPQALLAFDADEVEALEYYPWRRTFGSREPIDIRDLLEAPSEALVKRCYRLLLLRDPTPSEAERGAEKLACGWSPLVLVARLRWSAEGRQVGIVVPGIAPRLLPALAVSLARTATSAFRKGP